MSDHDDKPTSTAGQEPDKGELWGMMGMFETPSDLYQACEEMRDAGYKDIDAMTPFPVHGLEKALGLRATKLPWLVLAGGATGLAGGVALTWYCNWDYPLNISGKVPFSWQVYIPIYFELTVLISGVTCFFTLWVMSGLPKLFHATMRHRSFRRSSDDGFFLTVEATDPQYDSGETKALLEKLGAREVEEVHS